MYKIYADNTLIYDSTIDDFEIGKGSITKETNKSGSFVFSLYPDHPYYDNFVRLKTVITVYKDNSVVFRGRILNDVTDYWNNKVITCEGEMGFLQDSVIRPYEFTGTPEELFVKFITHHNEQVDDFKKFKIGSVTVTDPNAYIARSNSGYESTLSNLSSRLLEDSLGGYFHITHENGEVIPTIHYLADFETVASQVIEFGVNLKDYTKTIRADDLGTALIPLGATIDDNDPDTEDKRLTIAEVNEGKDYIYSAEGVSLYGWIFKTATWDDVTDAANLKAKAEEYIESLVNQNITIELTAIDLRMVDKSIESFNLNDYIHVISKPHNFDAILICSKQTIDLKKPENDSVTLGYNYSAFTETSTKIGNYVVQIPSIQSGVNKSISQNYATNEKLTNEIAETFNYGILNGIRGFYPNTGRNPEEFIPFLPEVVAEGTIVIASTSDAGVFIPLEVNTAYRLVVMTVATSTCAFRCYRDRSIYTSLNTSTGLPVYAQFDNGSGGTATWSITYTTTSVEGFGITLKPSSTSYKMRYLLLKVGGGEHIWT